MKYRITKYNPKYRTSDGAYMKNDWTSISDIGRIYDNNVLSREEYLKIENAHLNVISIIFEKFNSKGVIVRNLEKNFSYNEVKKHLFDISSIDIEKVFKSVKNNDVLNLQKTMIISTLVLRESLWCELLDVEKNFKITFGYDYYMYCECDSLSDEMIKQIEKQHLFVD